MAVGWEERVSSRIRSCRAVFPYKAGWGQGWVLGAKGGGLVGVFRADGSRAVRGKRRTDAPHLEASLVLCSCSPSAIPIPFPGDVLSSPLPVAGAR